jgi:hypothetical protein
MGYRERWDTERDGIPREMGYREGWDTERDGIPREMGYRERLDFRRHENYSEKKKGAYSEDKSDFISPVLTSLRESHVLAVLSWRSCTGSPVLTVLYWQSCPVLYTISACPSDPVLHVISNLSRTAYPILTVLY